MYKILLADDERIILDGMAGIIEWESLGASLIGKAQNGHEAYEKIVHKQPHIVITDVKMPGMDGLELIKRCQPSARRCNLSSCPGLESLSTQRKP